MATRAEKLVIRGVPSSPTTPPVVTVVVPAFNYARYLPACASSVLGQAGVEVRVIVVDDCSTDDTPRVTAELAADERVTVIRHRHNRGHIPSVNEALGLVDSEYVVKLDADDLLAPGSLARSTALLEAEPSVGLVYGRPGHFSGQAPRRRQASTRSWTLWQGREWLARRCRCGDNAISQPEVVMRTEVLRQLLPISADLPHTSDLHMWLRFASTSDVGRVNGPVQAYYRVHDQSMQRTVHAGELLRFRARRAAFDAAFVGEAGTLDGADRLRDVYRRSLARGALDCACHRYDRGRTRASGDSIDEFVSFALDTWPAARAFPEWRALQRRRAVGEQRAPRHPRFVADALGRRVAMEARRWRWRQTGEL